MCWVTAETVAHRRCLQGPIPQLGQQLPFPSGGCTGQTLLPVATVYLLSWLQRRRWLIEKRGCRPWASNRAAVRAEQDGAVGQLAASWAERTLGGSCRQSWCISTGTFLQSEPFTRAWTQREQDLLLLQAQNKPEHFGFSSPCYLGSRCTLWVTGTTHPHLGDLCTLTCHNELWAGSLKLWHDKLVSQSLGHQCSAGQEELQPVVWLGAAIISLRVWSLFSELWWSICKG